MTDSMFVSAARAARRPNRLPQLRNTLFALLALLALLAPVAAGAAAPPPTSPAAMTVVRVVAGRVDVDVPGSRRPAVGSRLVVERDGVTIADLEVTILRDHQASCRIVRMTAPIAGGDLVLAAPSGKAAKAASGNAPTAAAGSAEPAPQADDASEHPSNQTMIVQRVLRGAVDISLVGSQPVAVGDRLINRWLVTGMETHVCVFQTVRALREDAGAVHVVADACASRTKANWKSGLALAAAAGAVVTNTETVVFDLLGRAGTDDFRALSKLIK